MGGSQKYDDSIRVRVGSDRREDLERVAHERSSPGDTVTVSDVAQEAIDEHVDRDE